MADQCASKFQATAEQHQQAQALGLDLSKINPANIAAVLRLLADLLSKFSPS